MSKLKTCTNCGERIAVVMTQCPFCKYVSSPRQPRLGDDPQVFFDHVQFMAEKNVEALQGSLAAHREDTQRCVTELQHEVSELRLDVTRLEAQVAVLMALQEGGGE